MGLIARLLLILGGVIASWFVAPNATNHGFISFVAAMLLFVAFIALVTFWPSIWKWIKTLLKTEE